MSDFWVYALDAVIPLSDALLAIMDPGIKPYSGNAIPGISDCRGPDVDGLSILQAIPNTSDVLSKGHGLSKKGHLAESGVLQVSYYRDGNDTRDPLFPLRDPILC